jgi:hypothetical protein
MLGFYGSYRSDRMGIRPAKSWLSDWGVGATFVELIDVKAVSLPIRGRIYKEYPPAKAPERLQRVASKIRDADGPPIGEGGEALEGRFRALPTT